jgi:hypothetical protein
MRVRVQWLALVATTLVCGACGGSAAPPASSSTPPASTTPASASANAEFGVAECDDYMKKYLACLDRMAPDARTVARGAFDQTRSSWKQAASTDQGRAALAATCKAASDAAAPAMRAQGCSW